MYNICSCMMKHVIKAIMNSPYLAEMTKISRDFFITLFFKMHTKIISRPMERFSKQMWEGILSEIQGAILHINATSSSSWNNLYTIHSSDLRCPFIILPYPFYVNISQTKISSYTQQEGRTYGTRKTALLGSVFLI
jgi:hypothetical protein